ncbi:MAG: 3-phosphoglycerate dehydrogenase, partial [Clostridiales bacterium]|nr:3-phosphoglycerate dehydrogenase [Clostridiales bacterium]
MYKIHCLNKISKIGTDLLTQNYKLTDELNSADGVLVRSAAMHDMEFSDSLQAVARAGAGVNNIPIDECAQKGIVVFNTPGANANSVKELVLTGLFLASRDIVGGINWVQSAKEEDNIAKLVEKEKSKFAGSEVHGKKLGVIGLGAIGIRVANAALNLGMEVYGYDPYISVEAAWNLSRSVVHINAIDRIFSECDYITLHLPLTDTTKEMINKDS